MGTVSQRKRFVLLPVHLCFFFSNFYLNFSLSSVVSVVLLLDISSFPFAFSTLSRSRSSSTFFRTSRETTSALPSFLLYSFFIIILHILPGYRTLYCSILSNRIPRMTAKTLRRTRQVGTHGEHLVIRMVTIASACTYNIPQHPNQSKILIQKCLYTSIIFPTLAHKYPTV